MYSLLKMGLWNFNMDVCNYKNDILGILPMIKLVVYFYWSLEITVENNEFQENLINEIVYDEFWNTCNVNVRIRM